MKFLVKPPYEIFFIQYCFYFFWCTVQRKKKQFNWSIKKKKYFINLIYNTSGNNIVLCFVIGLKTEIKMNFIK